jgi:Ser/Thr protein kinase RdoA (MazF antagonist)
VTAIVPGSVEAVVFGTDDAGVIVERIAEVVRAAIGAELADVRWYVASVSCVAGVLVDDGREVVVRAYQPSVTARFVRGVVRAQTHVHAAGFPAPEPLSGPVQLPWGLGRAEALVADPGMRYPPASAMAVSAAGLAQLVTLLEEVDAEGLDEHPMLHVEGLYPTPHSPLFDFEATAAGAEWIDEIATAARAVLDTEDAPIVIGHTDWSSRNIRMDAGRVTAVYDWESLSATTEARALGVAAATWRALGLPDDPIAPDADELAAYIDAYAEVRPLSSGQRQIALAKAVHGMAYTARCEHSLHPGTRTARASARLADLAAIVSSA